MFFKFSPLFLLLASLVSAALAGPDIPLPQTRLLSAGLEAGTYRAGFEIALPPGWHTYWRNPGDAGMPPAFDTAGSENLASLTVSYPVPERYFDGFSTSFVYHDKVVLPLTIAPVMPGKPITLMLRVNYGYCKDICVPAEAAFTVRLAPDAPPDPEAADALAAARGRLPLAEKGMTPDARKEKRGPALGAVEKISGARKGSTALEVTVNTPSSGAVDLFVAALTGRPIVGVPLLKAQEGERAVFTVPLQGLDRAAPIRPVEFGFVMAADGVAVEAIRTIDLPLSE